MIFDCPEDMEVDPSPGIKNGRKLSRGEKSRIAAKSRRDKETIAMNDLIRQLPVSDEVLHKMDKTSVIKLAICYIKIKHFVQKDILTYSNKRLTGGNAITQTCVPQDAATSDCAESVLGEGEGQLMLEGLNGFLIFISRKGVIRFVSRNVKDHLGLEQEHLIGKKLLDIVHASDQQELVKQFSQDGLTDDNTGKTAITDSQSCPSYDKNPQKVFYLRMRYNLQKPGSKTKHTGYMLVQWTGKMKKHVSTKTGLLVSDGLLCVCRPMQTTPLVEIRMDGNMFMSRHDLGMTFTFCDARILTLIGYEPDEVIGKTAYHFHNPIDAPKVSDCHQNLIVKGNSVSKYYRFLGKTDNWVWLQTRATIIYNTNNKAQYIVCMNYVISEEEGERYLMLEEHKHANGTNNNVVITLPDNQHIHRTEQHSDNSGPKIVELCDENLKQTACLNGELDTPCNTSPLAPVCDAIPATVVPQRQDYHQHNDSQPLPLVNGIVYDQNNHLTQPAGEEIIQGSSLLPSIPQSTLQATDTPADYDMMVASQDSLDSSSLLSYSGSPTSQTNDQYITATDQAVDNNNGNVVTGSGSTSQSCSEDGGYESASSSYSSSYFSPQIVSPYSCNTSETMVGPALIQGQNCNLGVGYSGTSTTMSSAACGNVLQGGNSNNIYGNNATSELPDAENIIDELLQSFNQQDSMGNLDMSMAAVYSSIESLTSQAPPSVSTNVINLSTILPKQKQTAATRPVDKPLLRSFLTMPEDDIPKQPLTFLKICNRMRSSFDETKCASFSNRGCQGNQINFSAQNTSVSQGNGDYLGSFTAKMTHPQPVGCQGQDEELDLSEMPEDISDFALQYLDSMTDAQAQAVIADLNSDTFMDTNENGLTKDFLSSLESHCPPSTNEQLNPYNNLNNLSYGNVSVLNRFSQLPNYPSVGGNSQQNGRSGCQANQPRSAVNRQSTSSHDHGYTQSVKGVNGQNKSRSHKSDPSPSRLNKTACSKTQRPTYCTSETQTKMSELEFHLRDKTEDRYNRQTQNTSSKPFLQQLLTGELTKDSYMQMERERCSNQVKGLKPQ